MTINIAFKTPDAIVFATDGLSTLIDVDPRTGEERIVSSVADVEKLVVLSPGKESAGDAKNAVLAMFNGVGSLGNGSIAVELRAYDAGKPREPGELTFSYAQRLMSHLRDCALTNLGRLPSPFQIILAGFDALPSRVPPHVFSLQWSGADANAVNSDGPPVPKPLLHEPPGDQLRQHRYGPYYTGLYEAVARFVDGFDPRMPTQAFAALAGVGPESRLGELEQLIHEARRAGRPAPEILSNKECEELAKRYATRVIEALFKAERPALSEHYSLQAAVNYCVFLAQCAYARENWSPARRGAPRVGSRLQVAYLEHGRPPVALRRVEIGVNVSGPERDGG